LIGGCVAPLIIVLIAVGIAWTGPRVGHCAYCGYDLRGNTAGRCPECGRRWS
jgi:hypothetical protein